MKEFTWLILIWILGLLFRLPNVSRLPLDTHHIRQSDTSAIIRNMQRGGIDLLNPRIDWGGPVPVTVESELPLYNAVAAVALQDTPIQSSEGYRRTRLLSLMIWSVMVWVSVIWTRRCWPHLTYATMVVLVSSPLSVVFSQTIQPDMLAVALLMLGTERVYAYHQSNASNRIWALVGGLGAFSLSVMVKGTMLFAFPLFVIMLLKGESSRQMRFASLLGCFAAVSASMYWYYYSHTELGTSGATFGIWSSGAQKWGTLSVLSSLDTWRLLIEAIFYCMLTPVGLILAVIGFIKVVQNTEYLLFMPLVGGFIGVILTADGFRHHEYYWLYFIPWTAVVVAMGVDGLWRWVQRTTIVVKTAVALSACILFCWSVLTGGAYVKKSRIPDLRVLESATILKEHVPPRSKCLLIDRYAQSILFHSDRTAWRLGQMDGPFILDRIEDGLDFVVVFDPIPSKSDSETIAMLTEVGRSTPLKQNGWLFDLRDVSTIGAE